MNDYFSVYKKQFKAKYEMVKEGHDADYLLQPTTAKLRNLCMERYEDGNRSEDDKIVFKAFFGFEYDLAKRNDVVRLTEKFKPVKTFLLDETDIMESNKAAANMLAVLLDFEPRPYLKFKRKFDGNGIEEVNAPEALPPIKTPGSPGIGITNKNEEEETDAPEFKQDLQKPGKVKRTSIYLRVAFSLIVFIAAFYAIEYYGHDKQCMQWQNDHYEAIDCQQLTEFKTPILALDKKELSFRQIFPKKDDVFMENGQPIVWYAKSDTKVDFFNQDGTHPINGKSLGPATFHIMNTYGK